MDSNAKFLEEEEVEGISLVEDLDLVKQIHSKLGHYTHGPRDWFPVSWAVSLNQSNLHLLETTTYVVASKSRALRRYLLYVDSEGQVYMEGQTQNIFHVQPSLKTLFSMVILPDQAAKTIDQRLEMLTIN